MKSFKISYGWKSSIHNEQVAVHDEQTDGFWNIASDSATIATVPWNNFDGVTYRIGPVNIIGEKIDGDRFRSNDLCRHEIGDVFTVEKWSADTNSWTTIAPIQKSAQAKIDSIDCRKINSNTLPSLWIDRDGINGFVFTFA